MSNHSIDEACTNDDLKHGGLSTRFGMDIIAIHGFGHETLPKNEYWPERGNWFITCDWVDPDSGMVTTNRQVGMDRIVYDPDHPDGHNNMRALSKACMDYLAENGTWEPPVWVPHTNGGN